MSQEKAGWRWTWGYVENVASAIVLAATDARAAHQIYNIGEEQTRTQEEWVRSVARILGWNGRLAVVPAMELPRHLRETAPVEYRQHLALGSGKIRRELGFTEPVAFETGITRTADWLRASPPTGIDPAEFDYEAEDRCLEKFGS